MRRYLLFLCSLFLALTSFSQEIVSFNGKQYEKRFNNVWFEIESGFMIDSVVITIKLQPNTYKKDIKQIGKIIRQNSLGYIDIDISEKQGFFTQLNALAKDKEILSIDINTIGTYNRIQVTSNDPYLTNQWYLGRIKAFDAWDMTFGNPCISIGVLDSGTDWGHDDLGLGGDIYQNIWLNPGEDVWTNPNNPSTGNGIDDDSDGLIDNWKGWNYANATNDVRTTNSHGTQVAGIIAAKTNNGVGIAGIAGGNNEQGVKILPICIGVTNPNASIMDDAILHAVDKGVRVIQISAGVGSTNAIIDAIQYATDNGVIVVCAAGNGNTTVDFPANNANTISVGATNKNDQKASFSNYGSNLDLAAPGVDIYSTIISNQYAYADGTSFSAPMVSATVGLILSIDPSLSPNQIRNILTSTAEKVGGYTYVGGRCDEIGYGRLNTRAAVQVVMPIVSGPDLFCTSGVFTVNNLPTGTTISSWNVSPIDSITISGSGNSRTLTKAGTFNDELVLTVTLNTPCGTTDITTKAWVGIPRIDGVDFHNSVNNDSYFCSSHTGNTFKFHTYGNYAGPSDLFEVQLLSYPSMTLLHSQNYYGGEGEWTYTPSPGWYVIRARVIDHACGTAGNWSEYEVEFVDCSIL